jgi:hypothetical protein
MPRVGFEPMIPVFEREKTVHTSDLAATSRELYSVQSSRGISCVNAELVPDVSETASVSIIRDLLLSSLFIYVFIKKATYKEITSNYNSI